MNKTKIINAVLASTLLGSAVVGIGMLATDSYLWSAAPSHALGLLAFTALALVAAFAVLQLPKQYSRSTKFAFLGVVLLATVQLLLMAGDTIFGAPTGVSQDTFSAYLLDNPAFVTLLGIQPIVIVTGLAATRVLAQNRKAVDAVRVRRQVEVPAAN